MHKADPCFFVSVFQRETNAKIQYCRKHKERIMRDLFIRTSLVAKLLYLKFCNPCHDSFLTQALELAQGIFFFSTLRNISTLGLCALSIFSFFCHFTGVAPCGQCPPWQFQSCRVEPPLQCQPGV